MNTAEKLIADLTLQATNVLDTGRIILVLGVNPDNMQELHLLSKNDRQLELWLTDDNMGRKAPAKTGLVLQSGFLQHEFTSPIRNSLPDGAFYSNAQLGTGQLKEILRTAYKNRKAKNSITKATEPDPTLLAVQRHGHDNWSDSARAVDKLFTTMPELLKAWANMRREYTILQAKEQLNKIAAAELEALRHEMAELRADRDKLSEEVTQLRARETNCAELQDTVTILQLEVDGLNAKLVVAAADSTVATTRAETAEAALRKLQEAVQPIMALVGKP